MRSKILLADDHAVIRDGLKWILDDSNDLCVAGMAADGNEVLQKLREQHWDLVILDISMPGRSGLELIKLVRDEYPRVPILILSMHHEEQYAVRALQAGASGYLTKEANSKILLQVVRRILNGGIYVSGKTAELMAMGIRRVTREQPHELLSDREYTVFNQLIRGISLKDIADGLSLSIKTISTHKSHILQKMGMSNTVELVRYALAHDLIERQS